MSSEVLEDIKADVAKKIGSVKVEKVLDPEFDLHDLVIFDQNPLMVDTKDEKSLMSLARDNAQLVINQIFGGANLEKAGFLLYIFIC